MKKAISLILVIILSVLSFTSCTIIKYIFDQNCPYQFPGSTYSTDDNSIWFKVYEDPVTSRTEMIGEITKDGKVYECFVEVSISVSPSMVFISTEINKDPNTMHLDRADLEEKYYLLSGMGDFYSKNKFTLTVDEPWYGLEKQPLFEIGTTFQFYRTETAN